MGRQGSAETDDRNVASSDSPRTDDHARDTDRATCTGFGHLVVVPVGNEIDMLPLVDLACSLACPHHGKVVALLLARGEPEEPAQRLHQTMPVIDALRDDGLPVELVIHTSVSVTRGILDAPRELHADMLLLERESAGRDGAVWDDELRRDATAFDPSDIGVVSESLVRVDDPVEGFVGHTRDDDLAVADVAEQDEWVRWLRGDKSLDAVRGWPGGFVFYGSKTSNQSAIAFLGSGGVIAWSVDVNPSVIADSNTIDWAMTDRLTCTHRKTHRWPFIGDSSGAEGGMAEAGEPRRCGQQPR
jgi:hypothetical protein